MRFTLHLDVFYSSLKVNIKEFSLCICETISEYPADLKFTAIVYSGKSRQQQAK